MNFYFIYEGKNKIEQNMIFKRYIEYDDIILIY